MKPREMRVTVLRKWAAVRCCGFYFSAKGYSHEFTQQRVCLTTAGWKALAEAKGAKHGK